MIQFTATIEKIKSQSVLRLPEDASKRLPSRGQVAIIGTINGYEFMTVLEPDGYRGHWMRVNIELQKTAGVRVGSTVALVIEPTKIWPEPVVPKDFAKALDAAPSGVIDKWKDITPMARWEWVRWINETKNTDTRAVRINKSILKLGDKYRRPCCFNLTACTDPELSKAGKLIDTIEDARHVNLYDEDQTNQINK